MGLSGADPYFEIRRDRITAFVLEHSGGRLRVLRILDGRWSDTRQRRPSHWSAIMSR